MEDSSKTSFGWFLVRTVEIRLVRFFEARPNHNGKQYAIITATINSSRVDPGKISAWTPDESVEICILANMKEVSIDGNENYLLPNDFT